MLTSTTYTSSARWMKLRSSDEYRCLWSRMRGTVPVRLAGTVGERGLKQLSHHAPFRPDTC